MRTPQQDPEAGMRGLPVRKGLEPGPSGKGAAVEGGFRLFNKATVFAAALLLLAPACGQVLRVKDTESVTVTIGQPTVYYTTMSGDGVLVKHGDGVLNLSSVTVGKFRGSIRLEAGEVLIRQGRNLGKKDTGLIFSGGTLSFEPPSEDAAVTLGTRLLITVSTEGTFDTRADVVVNSTLAGSGELKKTGEGMLDFRKVQASLFAGTLRIEEGDLKIGSDQNLGSTQSVLELAGGRLLISSTVNVTLASDRQIVIEESLLIDAGRHGASIGSGISINADKDVTLTTAGRLALTGKTNIKNIYIKSYYSNYGIIQGILTVNADALGGTGPKMITINTVPYLMAGVRGFLALEQKAGGTGGTISNLHVKGSPAQKTGAGTLTFEGSRFYDGFHIHEGTVVDKGIEILVSGAYLGMHFTNPGTLVIDVDEGEKELSYHISRFSPTGSLLKKGIGLLDMSKTGYSNGVGKFGLQEGVVLIDEEEDLGADNATLSFMGGTLSFAGAPITLVDSRLITVATAGTFENTTSVVVRSSLVGFGTLRKRGSGELDFRNVQASLFAGKLHIEEGVVLIDEDDDLGHANATVSFMGGTLRFDGMSVTITVGAGRQIRVEDAGGTFDSMYDIVVNSTLAGSGLLRKTGSGWLDFSNTKATAFMGTLRIEEGDLKIGSDQNLGSTQSVLELAGGRLLISSTVNVTLASDRQIVIEESLLIDAGGHGASIGSGISINADKDVTLTITGRLALTGKTNIKNIYIKSYENSYGIVRGILTLNADALGGTGPKTITMNTVPYLMSGRRGLLVLEQKAEGTGGTISELHVKEGSVRKTGAGTLTFEKSEFVRGLSIEEGTVVDKGGMDKGGMTLHSSMHVSNSGTLVIDVDEGNKLALSYSIYSFPAGAGSLFKKGKGLLAMTKRYRYNGIGKFGLQEGVVSIDEDGDLGHANATLSFMGGTLSFANMSVIITVGAARQIRVENAGGTFDTMYDTVVNSTLAGSGELKKTGAGMLDFRNVQASLFAGKLRLEEGFLLIKDAKNLGSDIIFSGGGIEFANATTSVILTQDISFDSSQHKTTTIVLNNTLVIQSATVVSDSPVQVNSQAGNTKLVFDNPKYLTLNDWSFQGGMSSIEKKGTQVLLINNGVFKGTSSTINVIDENSVLILRNNAVPLSMGWAMNIGSNATLLLSMSASGAITTHVGPRLLSGSGILRKRGEGYLDMSKTNGNDFSGTLYIGKGTARIGSLGEDSTIVVQKNKDIDTMQEGGTMQGEGNVGSVEVRSGGTLYQGASSVTLHIRGDYTQREGGTYRVQLGPQFIPVTVDGKASVSGYFEVASVSGTLTDMYTILQAKGGVTGTLTRKNSPMFAQESVLIGENSLAVMRTGKNSPVYHEYAQGRNGAGVAWALTQVESSYGKPASYALLYIEDAPEARRALASLSGEMHVSAASAMMSSRGWIEDAAAGQMRLALGKPAYAGQRALRVPVAGLAVGSNAGGGLGVWSKSLETEKRYGGASDVRAFSYSSSGSLLGFDLPAGFWRAGLFSGTSQAQFAQKGATGSNDSYHAGMYGGRMWGATALRAGMAYSRHEIAMQRTLSLPGTDNRLASSYKAHTFAFFGQLERSFSLAGASVEPFVGLSHVRHTTEEFVETGAAGLAIRSDEQEVSASAASAGLEVSGGFRLGAMRMQARGMLAWKHGLGSREPVARQSLGASESFDVYGAGGLDDSLELEAGLDVRLSDDTGIRLTYSELDLLDAEGRDGHLKAVLKFAM